MKLFENNKGVIGAKNVALIGIMAATIECGKLVLSFLPNVEVVTLLCAIYGYVFGWLGVVATLVFVCVEPLIWGLGSWIVTYIIYWPLVAFAFMLLSKRGIKNRWIITAVAVGLTVAFGILSSVIDTAFYLGINQAYFRNFILYYVRGAVFYIVQTVCNGVIFPTLFTFLVEKLTLVKSTTNL